MLLIGLSEELIECENNKCDCKKLTPCDRNLVWLDIVILGCTWVSRGSSTGIIYSPGFPWSYPNNKLCDWYITVPASQIINLKFTAFELKASINCRDYVEVLGDSGSVEELLCGTQLNICSKNYSFSGPIRVRFNSASESNFPSIGFLAFYHTNPLETFTRKDHGSSQPESKWLICSQWSNAKSYVTSCFSDPCSLSQA